MTKLSCFWRLECLCCPTRLTHVLLTIMHLFMYPSIPFNIFSQVHLVPTTHHRWSPRTCKQQQDAHVMQQFFCIPSTGLCQLWQGTLCHSWRRSVCEQMIANEQETIVPRKHNKTNILIHVNPCYSKICQTVSHWKNTTKHMWTQKRCQLPNSIEVMTRKLVIALYP